MAPSRSRKAAAAADDKDDSSDKQPRWDSSDRNIQLHLQALKRWLPRQHAQFNNFIRFGYIINSRQEVVVSDNDHKALLQSGALVPGTFEKPWRPVESDSDEEDSYDSADSNVSSTRLRPLSAKKVKPKTTTTTTTPMDSPGGEEDAGEKYRIAPRALASFDEEVLETILETFDDDDTADDYRGECNGSAVQLIYILHKLARQISSADDTNIETRQDQLFKAGLAEPTVKAFNEFKSQYSAFNQARLAPRSDKKLANDYVQVVSRLGEALDVRLESKLDFNRAHGKLKRTIKSIRQTLGKFETNQETSYLLHGKSSGAYLGRDPAKGLNTPPKSELKPKKFDTSKDWKPADGPCPNKARGSGCDGKHWKKNCPNPNKIDGKPPPKLSPKKEPKNEENPLAGKSNVSRLEDNQQAAQALFYGGAKDVNLSDISSPAELLKAVTECESGRSCMAHAHAEESESEPDKSEPESDDESSNADGTDSEADSEPTTVTTLSDPTVHEPELYVVGTPTDPQVKPLTEGIYFGSWGAPDNLSQLFTNALSRWRAWSRRSMPASTLAPRPSSRGPAPSVS